MKNEKIINPGKDIKEMLYYCMRMVPDNGAFKVKKGGEIITVSFSDLYDQVRNLGTKLLSLGFGQKRIGIIGDNCYPWYCTFLAAVNSGIVAAPFDKGFTVEELSTCITRSKISALFYDEKHESIAHDAVKSSGMEVQLFKITGNDEVFSSMIEEGKQKIEEGDTSYDDVVIAEKELAILLFTSGTTSSSKAVMLSHYNLMSNIIDMQHFEDFYPWDVNMAFLPFHHSFGLVGVMVFLASGACNVFCDGLKYVQKNMTEYGVTVFVGVPLIVENLYKKVMKKIKKDGLEKKINTAIKLSRALKAVGIDKRRKIFAKVIEGLGGHLRLIIVGAAAVAPDAAQGLNDFGITTIQGYGLTETSPVLAAERPGDLACGSVGKSMPRVEIVLKDTDDEGIGEIVARGPNVMLGYLDQPEETAEVLKDGWFYTGDLGSFDKKGNLWIRGRKKNVIVMKNGKNIFPEEIEGLVGNLPYVAENMVFTREKHNEFVLWIKVVYRQDYLQQENISEDELAQQVRKDILAINSAMPQYKHINHFILTDQPMIKTTTQKVKRNLEIAEIALHQDEEKSYNI